MINSFDLLVTFDNTNPFTATRALMADALLKHIENVCKPSEFWYTEGYMQSIYNFTRALVRVTREERNWRNH